MLGLGLGLDSYFLEKEKTTFAWLVNMKLVDWWLVGLNYFFRKKEDNIDWNIIQ